MNGSDILVHDISNTPPYSTKVSSLSHNNSGSHLMGSPCSNPCDSPGNYHDNSDFLLDDNLDETTKFDNKISRRKMDHPRKRKRESDNTRILEQVIDTDNEPTSCTDSGVVNSTKEDDDDDDDILNLSSTNHTIGGFPDSPNVKRSTNMKSPLLPEDLSFRSIAQKEEVLQTDRKTSNSNHVGSSVKELEKVMDRHLPQKSTAFSSSCESDGILKDLHDSQKSAIQWIGGNSPAISTAEPLSASAFLRHLYTSRESVIRSNGRPYCYSDIAAINMLTPPGTEICKEQLQLNIPHISTQNKSSFSSNKESVSLITSSTDDFSMTPPSSVSPQEKLTSPFHEVDVSTGECLRLRGNSNSQVKTNPFSSLGESSTDMTKSHFLSVPNYHCQTPDLSSFSHEPNSSGPILYEARSSTNHGSWYSPSYHT